jgi:hypothetical protein
MFSFESALALGGRHLLKHVVKAELFPQLALLAQLFDEVSIE